MRVNRWSFDKLIKWTGIVALTVLLIPSGIYFTHEIASSSEQSLAERGTSIARNLVAQIVTPLLLEDHLTLHEIIRKAVTADTGVHYVCIENAGGEIVAHTFEEECSRELKELWEKNREQIFHFWTEGKPLMDIPEKILSGQLGTLHIGISRAQAVASLKRMIWVLGFLLVVAIGVILIGAHFIAIKVSSPLRHLEVEVSQYPKKICKKNGFKISGTSEVEALAKGFADMTQRLASLEREREATRKRMIQTERLAAMGELAAGLAHEVHNPLGGMQKCLNFLEEDPCKSERAVKYYPLLQEGLARIGKAMQGMLAFARSGQNVSLQACELNRIVDSLRLLVQAHLRDRQVQITWKNPNGCLCLCDAEGLAQAALNLILNAVEAAEGSELAVVRVEAGCNADWTYLTVENSGPGVPKELQKRIFEPFFSTKPIGKGTGLGLSVSRQIIRAAGGEVEMSSKPSVLGGACFIIRVRKTSCLECKNG